MARVRRKSKKGRRGVSTSAECRVHTVVCVVSGVWTERKECVEPMTTCGPRYKAAPGLGKPQSFEERATH